MDLLFKDIKYDEMLLPGTNSKLKNYPTLIMSLKEIIS
jgi:hypothetical protein